MKNQEIRAIIMRLIEKQKPGTVFTSEEVRDWLRPAQMELLKASPNSIGQCFRWAKSRGLIKQVSFSHATHRVAHGRLILVWSRTDV